MEERYRAASGEQPFVRITGHILIARDQGELIGKFKEIFTEAYSQSVAKRGSFAVSLSGGSTPKAIYRELVELPIDWTKVYFFFGDERYVSPDDAESNFHMAFEAMLSPLGISPDHIFRWQTELGPPDAVASDYAARLENHFSGIPRFDLFMLGLGSDAHTASLFPGTAALNETEKTAVANWVPKFDAFRLTLTAPVINRSRNVLFVVTGSDKAQALSSVIEGEYKPADAPAQLIRPGAGAPTWLVDEAAAAELRLI